VALDAAERAFTNQSGISSTLSGIQDYAKERAVRTATNLSIDKEFGAALFLYKCNKSKSVNFGLGGGKRLTLEPTQATISIPF
jgi:hypothetical protein